MQRVKDLLTQLDRLGDRLYWGLGVAALLVVVLLLFGAQVNWTVRGEVVVTSDITALMQAPEQDVALLIEGQAVNLMLVAYPGQAARGRVVSIGTDGVVDASGRVTFPVIVSIDSATGMTLRSGMTGTAEVVVARDAAFYVWSGRLTRAWLAWWQ